MIWGLYGPGGTKCPNCRHWEMALVPASHRLRLEEVAGLQLGCRRWKARSTTAHFTFAHLSFEKEENEILDIKKHFVNSDRARMNVDHMRWIAEDPASGDQNQSA